MKFREGIAEALGLEYTRNSIMDKNPDPLDPLLDQWSPPPPTPRHLRAEVWRRIAVMEAEEEAPSLWERIEAVFRRPSFALTFVAACMLAGLFMGEMRVAKVHAERSTQFAANYLGLIAPGLAASVQQGSETQDPSLP